MTAPTATHQEQGPLTVLTSTRAILTLPDDSLVLSPASISISPATGKIVEIACSVLPPSAFPAGTTYIDHGSKLLMPGLVDAHVHLNEPGRTEWEGFNTGTRAAASGGVTTVVDMPLNAIPPTTTLAGFHEKLAAAQGQCWVDVAFYGGIIPGNAHELLPLVEAGVRGFKGFLIESGVEEFPAVSSNDIALAMSTLNDTPTTLMFHAEMIPPISDSVGDGVQASEPPLAPKGDLSAYQTFLDSRPPSFETYAIDEIISLAPTHAPNLHLHIVHLSATQAIPLLRAARNDKKIKITAETCFHYLGLASEGIESGDCRYKCCPPIREQSNQDGLWEELVREDSVIRTVVSDHSPCTPELKLLPSHIAGSASSLSASCCSSSTSSAPAPSHPSSAFLLSPPSSTPASTSPSQSGTSTPASSASAAEIHPSDSAIDVSADLSLARSKHQQKLPPAPTSAAVTSTIPAPPNAGDFFAAWGGISSVGLGLPILHTASMARRASSSSLSAPDILAITQLCCVATAEQVGLSHRKGRLRAGFDADICVFDEEETWTLDSGGMHWKNQCSPWEGKEFVGRVRGCWVRGQEVYRDGAFVGEGPVGSTVVERRVR